MAEENSDELKPRKVSLLEQWGLGERWQRVCARSAIWFVSLLIITWIVRGMFFTFVDNYQLPYLYDSRTGRITIVQRTGYIPQWPIVQSVHHVDLRPMQVCISAIQRVLNCKLVQFDPAGIETFLAWHGRDDYDIGKGQFNEILKNYAYDGSGKSYPFLTVLRELKPEESTAGTEGKPR